MDPEAIENKGFKKLIASKSQRLKYIFTT